MEHTCVIMMWFNDSTTLQPKKCFDRLQQPFSSDVTLRVENLKLSAVFLVVVVLNVQNLKKGHSNVAVLEQQLKNINMRNLSL